ncbi:MAG: CidA/LrgA family protein [Romboutsia sp.]|nr:CidA/LrgA family protein [Romboutsia sp.]
MKLFNQLAIILGIWAIGEYTSSFLQNIITIPGSIIGMILLFLALQFKVIKLDNISYVGDLFLNNMAIFFVPAGVALIKSLDLISNNVFVLLITIFFSTIAVMYSTGFVVQKMINRKTKGDRNV